MNIKNCLLKAAQQGDILDYDCAERMACSSEECQEDHFALRKRSLYSHVRSYRNDLREYARQIVPSYATSPDYANTLVVVIDRKNLLMNK
jgi:flagellum-specific peptidoglycan hydrolase FlgJ